MYNIENLRTGVIGLGSMGKNHVRVYNEISNLVSVFDIDEKQGLDIQNKYDVKYYSDLSDFFDSVEAISVATPTSLHKKYTLAALEKGIHVLVEKPIATSIKDAEKMVSFAKKRDLVLAVGHIERHNPIVNEARTKITKGDWGDVITLSSRRFSNYPHRIKDVGVLLDLGIHDVDIINSFVDSKVQNIYSSGGSSTNSELEDHANILLNFESGVTGICEMNWLTPMKVRDLSITTTTHHIILDYINQRIDIYHSEFEDIDSSNLFGSKINVLKDTINVKKQEPLKNELIDFLSSIVSARKPLVTGEQAIESLRIVMEAINKLNK